jgi:hypothetical protein
MRMDVRDFSSLLLAESTRSQKLAVNDRLKIQQ